ncbi:hypothetical protein EXIGLDRAFT_347144 [Exidia glandulosa HHB12029]|uniref:Uncharacterized protein n=1 Tax=Exidia glandulosa HHB12029 TaxID=1314781 RepID=A0A165CFB2_EXIGL|nr:hypothetical protein EXIGLDRAFT_347144 [Exidia glandulosa HHB12029]
MTACCLLSFPSCHSKAASKDLLVTVEGYSNRIAICSALTWASSAVLTLLWYSTVLTIRCRVALPRDECASRLRPYDGAPVSWYRLLALRHSSCA